MKSRRVVLGLMVAVLTAGSLAGQTPVLGSIEAPYPSLPSQVKIAGATYAAGSVEYGPVGTFLVLSGEDLGVSGTVQFTPYQNQNNAEVAGTPVVATVTMWSPTVLFLTVPGGASSGLVTVTSEGRTSNGLPFIVTNGTYSGTCPSFPPASQLQILTSSLGNGESGQPYSATLDAQGGQTAYSWSIVRGSLPAGLSLNASTGIISGTPSGSTGPLDLSVQVTDSSSPPQIDDATLTLTIDPQTLTAGTVYSYTVGHDYVGNVTSYSDSTYNGGSIMGAWVYGYDTLNRLESGTASAGVFSGRSACWAYDSFGNRTDQATSNQPFQSSQNTESCQPAVGASLFSNVENTYTVSGTDPGTNRLQSTNASGVNASVAYDAAGNVIADGRNQYLYDPEGRLCAEMSPAPPSGGPAPMMAYLYDAEGNRIAKGMITTWSCDLTINGFAQSETYVLGQKGEELTQFDGSGTWERTNVYAAGALIGTYDTKGLHFQLSDPLGTRRMQTSYQGQPETDCQSWPFGDGLYCYPDPYAPYTADDAAPLHFTGKERDTESGNDYFGARYYASSMGRFMSPDPLYLEMHRLVDPQQLNLYMYGRNNPLSITDPTGLDITCGGTRCADYLSALQKDIKGFKIDYDKNGKVETVGDVDKKGLSKSDKAFLGAIDDAKNHVTINAVGGAGDSSVFFGASHGSSHTINFDQAALLDGPNNAGGMTSAGLVGHETLEGYDEAKGYSMMDGHNWAASLGFPGFDTSKVTGALVQGGMVVGLNGTFHVQGTSINEQIQTRYATPIPQADFLKGKGLPAPAYPVSVEKQQ